MIHHELVMFRLIVAGVLLTAAVSKSVTGLGGPMPTRLGNVMIRMAEPLVAFALLPAATARAGFLGAALLATSFVVGLAFFVSQGKFEGCACFGSLDRDISPLVSMFRGSMLFALAAIGAVLSWDEPGPDIWSWLQEHSMADRAGIVLGVSMMVVAFAIPGRIAALLSRLSRYHPETPASHSRPVISGFEPAGPVVGSVAPSWRDLFDGDRNAGIVMLVFLSESTNDLRMRCDDVPLVRVHVGQTSPIADAYRVRALPSAVLISADGVVMSRLAVGSTAIERLCASALMQPGTSHASTLPLVPQTASSCAPCRS